MTQPWIPGAQVILAAQDGGSMLGPDKAFMTWHWTVNDPNRTTMDTIVGVLQAKQAQGTVVHPMTGEIVQMIPGSRACRMLVNANGGVQTNRAGLFHGQVEIIGMPGVPLAQQSTPQGVAAIQRVAAWARANGVPDVWPGGGAPRSGSEPHARIAPNGPSGHYGHCDWMENTHWDGVLQEDQATVLGAPAPPPAPQPTPAPTLPRTLRRGDRGEDVRRLQAGLLRVFPLYAWPILMNGGSDGVFGPATEAVVKEFQRRVGIANDGVVGPITRGRLAGFGVRF